MKKQYTTPEIKVTIFDNIYTTEIDGEGNIVTAPLTGSEPDITTYPDFEW